MNEKMRRTLELFTIGESVLIATRNFTALAGMGLMGLEGSLVNFDEMIPEELRLISPEQILPLVSWINPDLTESAAILLENMASNPEYIVGTTTAALDLSMFAAIAWMGALTLDRARDRYLGIR